MGHGLSKMLPTGKEAVGKKEKVTAAEKNPGLVIQVLQGGLGAWGLK